MSVRTEREKEVIKAIEEYLQDEARGYNLSYSEEERCSLKSPTCRVVV